MRKPPLRSERIVLRDWIAEDVAPYWKHLTPGQDWQALDGPYYPRSQEADEAQVNRISGRIEADDWPSPRRVLVIADSVTNRLIGRISWYWQSRETYWLSVGLVIFDPASWGRGLGYEALGLWSQYLFDTMPEIVRLDLRTWSGNFGMMRLAEKLGFQLEATFRKARVVNGEYYDGLGYGVLREEWEQRFPSGFGNNHL